MEARKKAIEDGEEDLAIVIVGFVVDSLQDEMLGVSSEGEEDYEESEVEDNGRGYV